MNRSFWSGVAAGAAVTIALVSIAFRMRSAPAPPATVPKRAPVDVRPSEEPPSRPEAPSAESPKLPDVPAMSASRPEPAPSSPPAPLPSTEDRRKSLKEWVKELRALRTLSIGDEFPPEAVSWLELDEGQVHLLNQALRLEGTRMYETLRLQAAAKTPSLPLPSKNDYRVPMMLSSALDWQSPGWQETVGLLKGIRGETLQHSRAFLRDDQHSRLVSLLENYYSFEGSFTWSVGP